MITSTEQLRSFAVWATLFGPTFFATSIGLGVLVEYAVGLPVSIAAAVTVFAVAGGLATAVANALEDAALRATGLEATGSSA